MAPLPREESSVAQLSRLAGILGLLALIAAALIYLYNSAWAGAWAAVLALGVLLVGFYIASNPADVRAFFGRRQARQGALTVVAALFVVLIAVFVNVLGTRFHQRWDVTSTGEHSLSPQTVEVLKNLKQPVKFLAFYTANNQAGRQRAEDLFKEYTAQTDKIQVQFIDPQLDPTEAVRNQVRFDGTIIVQQGDQRQDVQTADEKALTSAIIKVTSGGQKTVTFLTGHAEPSIDDFDQGGFSEFKTALTGENFKVNSLNLPTVTAIPTDTAVLIIAAPQTPLSDDEQKQISDFVERGGSLMVMADAFPKVDLNRLVGKWGFDIAQGAVLDPTQARAGADPRVLLISTYPPSEITRGLPRTLFPLATRVKQTTTTPPESTYTQLIQTSDQAWLETDPNSPPRYDEGKDEKGPLSIAVSGEVAIGSAAGTPTPTPGGTPTPTPSDQASGAKKARIIVYGNTLFATNQVLTDPQLASSLGNRDLLLNSVNWLAQTDVPLATRANATVRRSMALSGLEAGFIAFTSIIALPAIVLVAGALAWWRRR